ncbi:MAG: hypothetical protein AAGA66_03140 [Bacteroidota bacterium]
MIKKATVLKETEVFESKSIDSQAIGSLHPDDFIDWIKEEHHESKFWLVVEQSSGKTGYILSENAFKWQECSLRNTSLKMYLENSEEIKYLKKGDTVYKIHPEKKGTANDANANTTIIADEKLNIGKVKFASLKTKSDPYDVIAVISMISATVLSLLVIYWAIVVMILGGRIFYGGLVISAVIVMWKFLYLLISSILETMRLFFYKLKTRS